MDEHIIEHIMSIVYYLSTLYLKSNQYNVEML